MTNASQHTTEQIQGIKPEVYRSSRFIPELGLSGPDIDRICFLDSRIGELRRKLREVSKVGSKQPNRVARLQRELGEAEAERGKYPQRIMEVIEFDGPPARRWVPEEALPWLLKTDWKPAN